MKAATELVFNSSVNTYSITGSYSTSGAMMGSVFKLNTGDELIGPRDTQSIRIGEISAVAVSFPSVINWSSRYNWVFTVENSAASTTRRFYLVEHDKLLNTLAYKGFISYTAQSLIGIKTSRGLKAVYYKYSDGYAILSGSVISGSGTLWYNANIPGGTRIGFGTNNPANVSVWYPIAAVNNDTKLSMGQYVGFSPGVAYVIEDLRLLYADTSATTTAGGLHMIKGISYDTFNLFGNLIFDFRTDDNGQGIYQLKDAATTTNTIAAGVDIESYSNVTSGSHKAYVLQADATAQARMYVYNIRARMSGSAMSSGSSTVPFVALTDRYALPASHVVSQLQNLTIGTLAHGPASGTPAAYFVSNVSATTRINRANLVGIVSGSTSWVNDSMLEVPPGGATTFAQTNALSAINYVSNIDALIVPTTTTPFRVYATKYQTDGRQFDNIFFQDTAQLNAGAADRSISATPNPRGAGFTVDGDGDGTLYFIPTSTTTTGITVLYSLSGGADWNYQPSAGQYLITPPLDTPNASKLYNAYVNFDKITSRRKGEEDSIFSLSREPFDIYYRTSGISDNSGSWTLLSETGDLSGAAAGTQIQFRFFFKMFGLTGIPAKIHSVSVVYENDSQDSHYQPTLSLSSSSSRYFTWKQVANWYGNIPTMRVRVYDADLNTLLLDDNTSSSVSGSWQYSTSGSTWYNYSSSAQNVGYFVRYTATTLPNNITARVLLTQN